MKRKNNLPFVVRPFVSEEVYTDRKEFDELLTYPRLKQLPEVRK